MASNDLATSKALSVRTHVTVASRPGTPRSNGEAASTPAKTSEPLTPQTPAGARTLDSASSTDDASAATAATPMSPDEALFSQALERQFMADLERCTRQRHADEGRSRFSLQDILHNPALAQAAWREIAGERASTSPTAAPTSPTGGATPHAVRESPVRREGGGLQVKCQQEMLHQLSTVAAIEADMAAESRINGEMAALLLARLAAGGAALSSAQRFVQVRARPGCRLRCLALQSLSGSIAALVTGSEGGHAQSQAERVHCRAWRTQSSA